MSKTLLLLRHGKSDWAATHDVDAQRPLNKRGRKASRAMGRLLAECGLIPDLVLCSTAVRTRSTLDEAMQAGAWSAEARLHDELYETDVAALIDLTRTVSAEHGRVLVIGHEPTLSELIASLCGGATVRFPTGALAAIECSVPDWAEVREGCGVLQWLVTPRLLTGV